VEGHVEQFRFNIRFDGLDADDHVIDMRYFGEALIGLERTLSLGLNTLATGSVPSSRGKLVLAIRATPPRDGCVQFDAVVEMSKGVLPLLKPVLISAGAKLAMHLVGAVVKRWAGQKKQAKVEVEAMLDLMRLEKDDRQREREHIERVIELSRPAAAQIVAPIGRSCEFLSLAANDDTTVFDVPMAQAVRSKSDLEVGEMETLLLRVDGVVVHSRSLKVEDPNEPGHFVSAEVRDPAFTDGENIYTQSVTKMLEVQAKATYRDGRLYRLHIMDAKLAA